MKIVILEDNSIEYALINNALNEWVLDYDIDLQIQHYKSGELFFRNKSNYDSNTELFILDIELGEINGIEVAKKLRLLGYKGDIIFITAYKDFVFEGYNVHAFNYLIKPIDKKLFFNCLNEIEKKRHSDSYIYRLKQTPISIPYNDIISFSVNRHYIDIATTNGVFEQFANLNTIINSLPAQFVQVHRSYIVNLAHVYKYSQNKVYLSNKSTVDVSRTYLTNFKNAYFRYTTRFNA